MEKRRTPSITSSASPGSLRRGPMRIRGCSRESRRGLTAAAPSATRAALEASRQPLRVDRPVASVNSVRGTLSIAREARHTSGRYEVCTQSPSVGDLGKRSPIRVDPSLIGAIVSSPCQPAQDARPGFSHSRPLGRRESSTSEATGHCVLPRSRLTTWGTTFQKCTAV